MKEIKCSASKGTERNRIKGTENWMRKTKKVILKMPNTNIINKAGFILYLHMKKDIA